MKIMDVLRSDKPVFIVDDIEDKKTKSLIGQINEQISNILEKLIKFNDFADSQLAGDYNKKIVKAKSLKEVYSNWSAINNVCSNLLKEEQNEINVFLNAKNQLLGNLKLLLASVSKSPVVCSYDVYGDDFALAKKDHSIVILGANNVIVIETLISELDNALVVEGNFGKVNGIELNANYDFVEENVNACKRGIDDRGFSNQNKEEKVLALIQTMEDAARDLVLFSTYKEDIKLIGCTSKEIDLKEKELLKKYVPLKKQLSKLLKVQFVDICNVKSDEDEFPTQEFNIFDE